MSQPHAPLVVLAPHQPATIDQLVEQVAARTGEHTATIYARIYGRLRSLFRIDVTLLPKQAGEALLTVAQRHGLLDKLYALAYAEWLYASCQAE